MVFAPVLDINNNYNNPIINFRSYSDNPQTVIDFSLPFIDGLQSKKVIACGKYFPGHGDTDTDSHTSLPVNNGCARFVSQFDDKIQQLFQKITNNILREQ